MNLTYADGSAYQCLRLWTGTLGTVPPAPNAGPLMSNSLGTWSTSTTAPATSAAADADAQCTQVTPPSGGSGPVTPPSSGGQFVERAGDTMTGPLGMTNNKIVDVADGELSATSQDAVNGRQLYATNQALGTIATTANSSASALNQLGVGTAAALGGGSSYDPVTGTLTQPNYVVQGSSVNSVGAALAALDAAVASAGGGSANSVQYDSSARTSVTLGGVGATTRVTVTNLADGNLVAGSTDAATAGQLFTTNQNVGSLGGRVTTVENNITAIDARVTNNTSAITSIDGRTTVNETNIAALQNGTAGIVQQANSSAPITVGQGSGGTSVSIAGTDGNRTLSGVASGALSATSSDAVTGAQLFTTNQALALLDDRVDVTEVAVTNLDARTTLNETNIAALQNGTAGIVRQASDTSPITVGGQSGGVSVDFTGTQGNRVLTGVADGRVVAGSNDAVTGNQLFQTNQALASLGSNVTAIQNGTIGIVRQDTVSRNITVGAETDGRLVSVAGTQGNRVVTGVSAGTLGASSSDAVNGSQLFATNQNVTALGVRVTTAEADIDAAEARIAVNETDIDALEAGRTGVVRQNAGSGAVSVAGHTGGSLVSVSGTDGNRVVTGVADGRLAAGSSDAATAGQLFTTNQNVTALAGRVSTNEADIDAAEARIAVNETDIDALEAGRTGVVRQNATTGAVAIAAHTGGNSVSLAGTAGDRRLSGVAGGALSASSSEAVNGAQLFATNQAVDRNAMAIVEVEDGVDRVRTTIERTASAIGGGASYDRINDLWTGPAYVVLGQTRNDVGSALAALDDGIGQLREDVERGQVGLVQQATPSSPVTVAAATGGTSVSFAGVDGPRTLTGVRSGRVAAGSTDVVTGGQFFDYQQLTDGRLSVLEQGIDGVRFDLSQLRRDLNSGVATAAALSTMPHSVNPGRGVFGLSTGYRGGEFAVAGGLSYRTTDDVATFSLRAGYDSSQVTLAGGVGLEF